MSTPKDTKYKPTPELLLALSDLVAGLVENRVGGQWALVGEAVQNVSIRRSQVLIVTALVDATHDDLNDEPDMVLLAGPEEIRQANFRAVDIEPRS